jgi:uncharacterized protein with WD repeat
MNNKIKLTHFSKKRKTKFQQILWLSALLGGMVSGGVIAAEEQQPYGKLSKQLDIMGNIFVSSLQALQDKSLKNTRIESLYLAGQGVVFTIKSANNSSWSRNGYSFVFSGGEVPVPPVAPLEGSNSFEFFDNSDELAEQMESAFEQQSEYSREFREQQRDLDYELRDIERENRDLAYQVRNVSEEEKKELVEKQKVISKQKAELKKSRVVLAEKLKKLEKEQNIVKEKRIAMRKKHYQKLTTSLVETLCTYGNGLKALPKGEHLSLVLKSAGDKVSKNYQDKVVVLNKSDINACSTDKISAEKLLSTAKTYQF